MWSFKDQRRQCVCGFLPGVQSVAVSSGRRLAVTPPGGGESGPEPASGPDTDRGPEPGGRRRGRAGLPPRGNRSWAAGVLVPSFGRRPHRYLAAQGQLWIKPAGEFVFLDI